MSEKLNDVYIIPASSKREINNVEAKVPRIPKMPRNNQNVPYIFMLLAFLASVILFL